MFLRWNLLDKMGWMNRRYGRAWGSNKIIFMYIVFRSKMDLPPCSPRKIVEIAS